MLRSRPVLSVSRAFLSSSRTFFLLTLLLLPIPSLVHAEAFRIPYQSASGVAQGNAFAAQADDPSALHYNPAGMTQLPRVQYSLGINLVGGSFSHTSPTGGIVTGDFNGPIANPPPANFYLTANLKDLGAKTFSNLTLGLGITAPFGTLLDYPKDAPFASVTTFAALPLMDIKPTVGVKVNEYISIGGGLDIYTFASFLGEGQAELKSVSGSGLVPLGIPQGSDIEINGTDTAVGFNVGLLYTPMRNPDGKPLLNFAFVYRSQTTLALQGAALVNGARFSDASVDLNLPQIFTWALAAWPLRADDEEWKVEVDVDHADWSSFKNLDIHLSNGVTLPQPRNWRAVFVINVGTEYRWLSPKSLPDWEVALRGGYVRSESPIPDRTFDPAVPDSDYNAFSIGTGFLCKGRGRFLGLMQCDSGNEGWIPLRGIGLDFAYQGALYESRTITNNIFPSVNGTWDGVVHIGSMNLRVNF